MKARHYTARRPLHRVNWRVGGSRRQLKLKMAQIRLPHEKLQSQVVYITVSTSSAGVVTLDWKETP